MPYKVNEARRHKIPKARYRVENWAEYDAALVRRGSLTVWVTPEAIAAWTPEQTGRRGRPQQYSDVAVETGLMLRLAPAFARTRFGRPWRQTEGVLASIMGLLGLDLPVPDNTTFSRRSAGLSVSSALRRAAGPVIVVIDSTGLRVFGAGEWQQEKHGGKPRRTWRKLHLAVDPDNGEILASELTTTEDGDATLVGPLLGQIPQEITAVLADGAYDGEPSYGKVADRDAAARVVIPPRITAVVGSAAEPTQRDRHIQAIAERGRMGWQRQTDYVKRAKAETAMARYKGILGDHLHARALPGQQAEAAIGVAVLNRMIEAGRRSSVRIA